MTVSLVFAILHGVCSLVAVGVSEYPRGLVPLSDGSLLFADTDGELWTVRADNDFELAPWVPQWDWQSLGWTEVVRLSYLTGSADGELVCCGFTVRPTVDSIPFPEAIVVFNSDGSNGRPVALSFNVGCGPLFDFTKDSKSLYGIPILSCGVDAASFLAMHSGDQEYEPADMVNLLTGDRSYHDGYLSDGYFASPYSDIVCCGYPPSVFYDMKSSDALFEINDGYSILIDTWVLPDAGVVSTSSGQVLRYVDGTEVLNPGEPVDVLLCLPDGDYLCGYADKVYLCGMDWESFSITDPVTQNDLAGMNWEGMCVQGDQVFFQRSDSLFTTPLQR